MCDLVEFHVSRFSVRITHPARITAGDKSCALHTQWQTRKFSFLVRFSKTAMWCSHRSTYPRTLVLQAQPCDAQANQCQFARVAKGVDLRSTGGNSAWVRAPQMTCPEGKGGDMCVCSHYPLQASTLRCAETVGSVSYERRCARAGQCHFARVAKGEGEGWT